MLTSSEQKAIDILVRARTRFVLSVHYDDGDKVAKAPASTALNIRDGWIGRHRENFVPITDSYLVKSWMQETNLVATKGASSGMSIRPNVGILPGTVESSGTVYCVLDIDRGGEEALSELMQYLEVDAGFIPSVNYSEENFKGHLWVKVDQDTNTDGLDGDFIVPSKFDTDSEKTGEIIFLNKWADTRMEQIINVLSETKNCPVVSADKIRALRKTNESKTSSESIVKTIDRETQARSRAIRGIAGLPPGYTQGTFEDERISTGKFRSGTEWAGDGNWNEGSRNETLKSKAWAIFVNPESLPPESAEYNDALIALHQVALQSGLDDGEIRRTISSARRNAKSKNVRGNADSKLQDIKATRSNVRRSSRNNEKEKPAPAQQRIHDEDAWKRFIEQHGWRTFQEFDQPLADGTPVILRTYIEPFEFAKAMVECCGKDMKYSGRSKEDYTIYFCDDNGLWHPKLPKNRMVNDAIIQLFCQKTHDYIYTFEEFKDSLDISDYNGQKFYQKVTDGLARLEGSAMLELFPIEIITSENCVFWENGDVEFLDEAEERIILRDENGLVIVESREIIKDFHFLGNCPRLPMFDEPDGDDIEWFDWVKEFYPDDLFEIFGQLIISPHKGMGLYIKEISDGGKTTIRDAVGRALGGYSQFSRAEETVSSISAGGSRFDNAKLKYGDGVKIVQIDEVDKTGITGKIFQLTESSISDINPKFGGQVSITRTANTMMYAGGIPLFDPRAQGYNNRILFVLYDKSEETHDFYYEIVRNDGVIKLLQDYIIARAKHIYTFGQIGKPNERMEKDAAELFHKNKPEIESFLEKEYQYFKNAFTTNDSLKEVLKDAGITLPKGDNGLSAVVRNIFPGVINKQHSIQGKKLRGFENLAPKIDKQQDEE